MGVSKNMLNYKFGLLTVTGRARPGDKRSPGVYWLCSCECGAAKVVLGTLLRKGATRSCGCMVAAAGRASRKPPGFSGLTKLFNSYRDAAANRKLEFSLSRADFEALTSSNCWYCGQSPSSLSTAANTVTAEGKRHSTYEYNGIDRRNNALGYTSDNCVSACERCNRAKYTFSEESFLQWVDRIYSKRHQP